MNLERGAVLSEDRVYRYVLWRRWDSSGELGNVVFIGLNPSTADENEDDPTIRRCIGFAKDWGYGGLIMLNAYAFRATDPNHMKRQFNPIGPDNDRSLKEHCHKANLIVAAWGQHCRQDREISVCRTVGKAINCLGRTKSGRPKHPLYLKADTKLELFWAPTTYQMKGNVPATVVSGDGSRREGC